MKKIHYVTIGVLVLLLSYAAAASAHEAYSNWYWSKVAAQIEQKVVDDYMARAEECNQRYIAALKANFRKAYVEAYQECVYEMVTGRSR